MGCDTVGLLWFHFASKLDINQGFSFSSSFIDNERLLRASA